MFGNLNSFFLSDTGINEIRTNQKIDCNKKSIFKFVPKYITSLLLK